jgi:hypothetical protein
LIDWTSCRPLIGMAGRVGPIALFVEFGGTTAAQYNIGARLEVGVDVVNVWRDVWISGKALHDRRSIALAVVYDTPEGFKGLSHEPGSGRTRVEGLGSCSGRSCRPPILKRFASECAERIAGNEMALDVECVLDRGMNGQEPLC